MAVDAVKGKLHTFAVIVKFRVSVFDVNNVNTSV